MHVHFKIAFLLYVVFSSSPQASEQSKRYDALSTQCRIVSGQQDLNSFLRFLQPDSPKVPRKSYAPPQSGPGDADDVLVYSVSDVLFKCC